VLSFQFDVTEDYPPLQKKQDWVAKLYEMADAISEAAGQVIPIQVFGALYQDYYNKVFTRIESDRIESDRIESSQTESNRTNTIAHTM